ncbi:MAG: 1-acyl-sn-glycerol-3-phosphate acyltransferase [Deltaproteobacteria bacterium]|nr:1-acyl-sn-glycerol-3-phosphate acyltransferase [Deltaproteobacteria bacterium]
MRNTLRDAAIVELKSRVLEACIMQSRLPDGMPLDVLVNDTLHHEKKRLETDRKNPRWAEDVAFWDGIKNKLGKGGDDDVRALLASVIGRFADEIRGNFSPPLYQVATRVLPKALPMLLNAMSPRRLFQRGIPDISDTIAIQGNVDGLKKVAERGTIILTPTHVSNLDSPVVGWAIYAMGLPAFTYGAGLNLFSNPVMALFMRNLGAYRVDRNKTAPLYKDVLKEYATVSMELGNHNLFFPAGTRVRSGKIEQHLKLGLMSSGIKAYINNLQRKRDKPNLYIVPCTLNYYLVLEAETLIEEHLKREGKSRYIIAQDESYLVRKYLQFTQNLINLEARITLHVGDPIDPFGNRVDPDTGDSLDRHGRNIDITRYVTDRGGNPVHLPQRDRVYTSEAGVSVARQFLRHNVVVATQLVAFTLWEMLTRRHPDMDLYRLVRTGDEGLGVSLQVLTEKVMKVWQVVHERATRGELHLESGVVASGDAAAIVRAALRHFGTYHARPVITRRGDRAFCEDMKLLLYYSNRLRGYGLEREIAPIVGTEAAA